MAKSRIFRISGSYKSRQNRSLSARPVPIDSARRDEAIDVSHAQIRAAQRNLPFYVTHGCHEASLPHTTVHTWHESTNMPEQVTTEVDEHGNVVRRTIVKAEQVKHTVQTQSYQTYAVDENTAPASVLSHSPAGRAQPPPPPQRSDVPPQGVSPVNGTSPIETHTRTVAYENGIRSAQPTTDDFEPGDLVSTKAVTTGNRTVETLTYKKERDGVTETHVEHRITIHGGDDIDHDAELSRAILEATNMNPEMTVEKVDTKLERH
ncbi:protein 4.1 like protein [Ditylenchus destructor]|uniref:Protein 4.1 like protein n=1 Tax=Ditylenchus destructor TaxID=166010 RepID=A0AAD4NFA5_9BILA|nr:protein 4.1 like protein [Ditylenchus destructor]